MRTPTSLHVRSPSNVSKPSASLDATQSALAADGDLLSPHEPRCPFAPAVDEVRRLARRRRSSRACCRAIAALNTATGHFAELRMDRSVAQALTGRSVDAIS